MTLPAGQSIEIIAPLNHPSYAGHFPGRPIVPGVLLLDLVVAAIDRGAPRGFGSVKFLQAVLPGDTLSLHWTATDSRATFRCARRDEPVVEGTIDFA